MERRNGRIIVNSPGGNASCASKTFKASLPNKWIEEMGLVNDKREIELSFDGKNIVISKKRTVNSFINQRKDNELFKLEYFNSNELCTTIIADYSENEIAIENHTDSNLHRAFGKNETPPTWEDYLEFLESRCVPRSRDRLRNYLEALGLDSYEPFEIIVKTEGRMAEDTQWLRVTKI